MRHGDARDPDIFSHHDRSRPLIDNHPRLAFRFNLDILDPTQCMSRRDFLGGANIKQHRARIEHPRDGSAIGLVDRDFDAFGGREISGSQSQADRAELSEIKFDLALDPRAGRDHARGRHTLNLGRPSRRQRQRHLR